MRASTNTASASGLADHQHLLARQHALEVELMRARQSHRGLKRKNAAAVAASVLPVDDAGGEAWMMTYLDMMTLLLVVTMAMLAMAGKNHDHLQKADLNLNRIFSAKILTQLDPPGKLLLVPQVKTPADPEPTPEPVTSTDLASLDAPTSVAATTEVAAIEPAVAIEPAPSVPAKPSLDDLLKELPLDKLGNDIEVVTSESTVSFRINSEILFPSGQSDLNLGGLRVLQHLIPVLGSVPHKVIVAGHTDTQDIRSSRFPSNWELSGARAGSVVRYLQSNGIKSNRLAAVGYADTHPLGDNTTAEGRASNRRVELILER